MESNAAVMLQYEDLAVKEYLFYRVGAFVGENLKVFNSVLLINVKKGH